MSAPEDREFEVLLTEFANRELSSAEAGTRLRALAAEDADREARLEEIEAVHALLDEERGLRAEIVENAAEPRPEEASDPVFRRLESAAAQSADDIRTRYASTVAATQGARSAQRWRAIAIAISMAAVVVFGVSYLFGDGRPGLSTDRPGDSTLGGERAIALTGTLPIDEPMWRWPAVSGAASYEATLARADGTVVLQRAAGAAASTEWVLDADQQVFVRREAGRSRLWLRVDAFDANRAVVARGNVEVELVE